jgi:hypothetical protein
MFKNIYEKKNLEKKCVNIFKNEKIFVNMILIVSY